MNEDQAYRATDSLMATNTCAEVQEHVFFEMVNVFNFEVDVIQTLRLIKDARIGGVGASRGSARRCQGWMGVTVT